jgi:hypothetical protein
LSVNGSVEPEVQTGWPLIVTATVLGGMGSKLELAVDDLTLQVSDAAGAKALWPIVRVSKSARLKVDETTAASVTWVMADTATLKPGRYTIAATLKGGAGNTIAVHIGSAPTTQSTEAEAERLALEVQARLLQGDGAAALAQAEKRSAAFPAESLGFDLKGDALLALGRKKEAQAAYGQAISLFTAAHAKDHMMPTLLLAKLRAVKTDDLSP